MLRSELRRAPHTLTIFLLTRKSFDIFFFNEIMLFYCYWINCLLFSVSFKPFDFFGEGGEVVHFLNWGEYNIQGGHKDTFLIMSPLWLFRPTKQNKMWDIIIWRCELEIAVNKKNGARLLLRWKFFKFLKWQRLLFPIPKL